MRVLQQFRFNPALNTLFISKVGDTSIDIPEANCLIQISSQYGSRRQEAQRLGRILRAKKGMQNGYNAFFYSLVTPDTEEMYHATKRKQFLIDQGYEYKLITHLEGLEDNEHLIYRDLTKQIELLNTVLLAAASDLDDEDLDIADAIEEDDTDAHESAVTVKRVTGFGLASLSGGDSMAYLEYNRGTTSNLDKSSRFFRRRN